MLVWPILAATFVMKVVAVLFVVSAVVLILVVLIQKGRGGGLSAAFGGGMAGGILGSKTGDFLTWVTIGVAGLFLLLAVVMDKYHGPGVTRFESEVESTAGEDAGGGAVGGGSDTAGTAPAAATERADAN